MGILKRLLGDDERPRRSSTISVDLVAPTPELRLSRRDTPRSRPNKYGPGEVHVTGYHFVHADGRGLADQDDLRL